MSQICQNLNESRHYLVYKFIQFLKNLRHLFWDRGSSRKYISYATMFSWWIWYLVLSNYLTVKS